MTSLRETLSALEAEGRLTPARVVEEARAHPGSPLHAHIFALTDEEAAERHRLDRARSLIRTFKVNYITPAGEKHTVRQFVSVATPQGTAYRATEEVLQDPLAAKILFQAMERDVQALVRRYAHMREFRAILQSVIDSDETAS